MNVLEMIGVAFVVLAALSVIGAISYVAYWVYANIEDLKYAQERIRSNLREIDHEIWMMSKNIGEKNDSQGNS